MSLLLLALVALFASGVLSLCCGRHARFLAALGVGVGAVLGIYPALRCLHDGQTTLFKLAWGLPIGAFSLRLDPLSAFFIIPMLGLCALAAVYGVGYMGERGPRTWFFYNSLAASMLLALLAQDGVLFLIAWELMTLASYFLVAHEDDKDDARQAGFTYLVAAHVGTAFLLVMFVLLGLEFSPVAGHATAVFLLAMLGFGTKAGFIPMHVWLPDAHPAAPSHVSAVMSGVMIKTGIYGLLRVLTLMPALPPWWGWSLVAVGVVSGVLGVLFALAQRDMKRLLAYSSIDNIGIIALGIGTGMLGQAHSMPLVAALGYGGALLHVLNHTLFKGLLFLGAGAVLHATGTRDMEHMGGLMKRMPWTGSFFMVGAAAICGLPPLNGFVSEFLIFLGAFLAVLQGHAAWGGVVIGSLALIGGLALACFTKAFGIVFLGEPRGQKAASAHEAPAPMLFAMSLLAAACLLIGISGPLALGLASKAVGQACGLESALLVPALNVAFIPLACACAAGIVLILLILLIAALRAWLLVGREKGTAATWDCGYAAPTARMQYTASSFAQPITELFSGVLRTHERSKDPEGYFPSHASYSTETPDLFRESIYKPFFEGVFKAAWKLRILQHGRIQVYLLYIALTLALLLVWKLGWP